MRKRRTSHKQDKMPPESLCLSHVFAIMTHDMAAAQSIVVSSCWPKKVLATTLEPNSCFSEGPCQLSGPIRYRETISAIPPHCAMGFLVSQHCQLGAIPPPPFSEHCPLGEHAKWRCDTPQKRYLSDACAISYENKANGCDTPLCDTISKGYCAIRGGISHWAAKHVNFLSRWR